MPKRHASARSVVRLPLVLCIALLLTCTVRSLSFAGMPVPGQQAPDFSLPGLFDPQTVSLKDLKGKVVLMNIWASWCTSCKEEMEDLVIVQEQYGPRGFAFVAVNIDNSPAAAVEFMSRLEAKRKKKPAGTFLYDKDKIVPKAYLQRAMPTSYLIDREGKFRKMYLGSFSKSTLAALTADVEEALK
jgi:cytochrome c biogenesis protein CcmG, thiol:disulfide interchange protein DsbE